MEIKDSIVHIISTYKYAGLYLLFIIDTLGVFLPTKTILTFTGILVQKGFLSFPPLFLSAITGSLTGYSISYIIGLKLGKPFLLKYGRYLFITSHKLESTEKWFSRYGPAFIIIAYFIPGVRHISPYLSGISGMKFSRTLFFAGTGAALWITTFVSLGKLFGENLQYIYDLWNSYRSYAIAAAALAVLLAAGINIYRRKKKKSS
ncbi:MAG: DedA family protein [Desulfocucumaceae bacterium]